MAPHRSHTARLAALAAALCVLLALAGDAAARKFRMSGSWVDRRGQIFLPLQFVSSHNNPPWLRLSMGSLTNALGFPNGPVTGQGGVTATGSAPATLRIPQHRFVEDAMALAPLPGLLQITTQLGIDAPYAPATLAAGGGPGSFTWCPGDPACVAGGGMWATDPPQGAGRAGRIIYRAGANQFGGAMQLGLRGGGVAAVSFGTGLPRRAGLIPVFGQGATLRGQAVGGLGSPDVPATEKVFLSHGFATQPTLWPAMGSPILHPGPKVTTMFGVTTTGTGAVFYLPTIAMGPMGTLAGQLTTHYGFAHTTGTVLVQNTGYSTSFFTLMGSDARTPLGAGNISLVAGGLSFRRNTTTPTGASYGTFAKVSLTLAPPIPSLSPAGAAAAGALLLLAVGYALRRRFA